MSRGGGLSGRSALLAAVIVAAMGGAAWRLIQGTATERVLIAPADKVSWAKPALDVPVGAANINGLRNRPLMYATRALYVASPVQVPVAPPVPAYKLAGTLMVPHKLPRAMLVPNGGGRTVSVKPGDALEGWTVQSVDLQRVVLAYDDQRAELAKSGGGPAVGRLGRAALGSAGKTATGELLSVDLQGEGRLLGAGSSARVASSLPRGKAALFTAPRAYQPPPK